MEMLIKEEKTLIENSRADENFQTEPHSKPINNHQLFLNIVSNLTAFIL